MKENFLTIPDAPNYEVNSDLIVRNKKTGRIIKPQYDGRIAVQLHNCKRIQKQPHTFRRLAKAALDKREWFPVPSLNYLYELNKHGLLRRIKSKRLLKLNNKLCYHISINGKGLKVSRSSLLWEVFGKTFCSSLPVPTTLIKDRRVYHFPSLNQAILFLAPKINYSYGRINDIFKNRLTNFCGWKISYGD